MLTGNHQTSASSPDLLVEGEDYYLEDGLFVMTADYHRKRGSCCGSGCRWCPFEPHHEPGATKLGLDVRISNEGKP